MKALVLALGLVAGGILAVAPAEASSFTFAYDGFGGTPLSITGDFSLVDGSDVIGSLSGRVNGEAISAFLSGTYDGDQFTANFATRLAAYNLNGSNGFFAVVTSGGDFTSLGSLTIGAVPVPGSAPLFGASLLVLGASGLARKHVRAVARRTGSAPA